MNSELLSYLQPITLEEQEILEGQVNIKKEIYTTKKDFIIDSQKLLEKGRLIEIRPHTRFAHFPKHKHNYVEMVYMCSGKTTHIINDTETISLSKGELLFLNQNVTQEILPASKDDIAVNFIILPEFFNRSISMIEKDNVVWDFLISSLSENTTLLSYLHFAASDILPVQNLIENMIWTLIHKKTATNNLNQITMGLLLMNLSMFADKINQSNPTRHEENLVFSILKYIESHYKSGTLTEICEEIKQPTYYVSRLLKKHTGCNFKELLQQQKLQQASYLLSQTSLSIEAIMGAIGYDNSSYFYRIFKTRYGCSPKNYRLNLNN